MVVGKEESFGHGFWTMDHRPNERRDDRGAREGGKGGNGEDGAGAREGKQPRRNGILFVWGGVWLGVGDEVRSCSCHLLPGKKE